MQDALTSLLISFGVVASLGWVVLANTWIRERREKRIQKGTTFRDSSRWVHRRNEPFRRFKVVLPEADFVASSGGFVRPKGDFVCLEDQKGQRIVLSGRRFETEFETSP